MCLNSCKSPCYSKNSFKAQENMHGEKNKHNNWTEKPDICTLKFNNNYYRDIERNLQFYLLLPGPALSHPPSPSAHLPRKSENQTFSMVSHLHSILWHIYTPAQTLATPKSMSKTKIHLFTSLKRNKQQQQKTWNILSSLKTKCLRKVLLFDADSDKWSKQPLTWKQMQALFNSLHFVFLSLNS